MGRPMPPPDFNALVNELVSSNPQRLVQLFPVSNSMLSSEYLHWDRLRYKTPPDGLNHDEWWLKTKLARHSVQRALPMSDKVGRPFVYALPDVVLQELENINRDASGEIRISEEVMNPATRDRYVISSLIEEAINSSQLEGATTTRNVAKEMIRSGRPPRDRDERMILNNYRAMRFIGELRETRLTPELVCEIHHVVTEGTLADPDASGRFRLPGEDKVGVYTEEDKLLHAPPNVELIPERMERLCRFANGDLGSAYIPPVLRAVTIHFMLVYEHPFEDGNGRTARALFYWSMLNQGFWLTEFVAISPFLKRAPGRYRDSFLYTETDENDLTYFHIYQLDVLRRAIVRLHEYLRVKMAEARKLQASLSSLSGVFNHRQIAILQHALKHGDAVFTARSHMTSHNVVYETARQDLLDLERQGLLVRSARGQQHLWTSAQDLERYLQRSN